MNGYVALVAGIVLASIFIAPVGLKYSHATVLFGLVAAGLAPVAMHKVPDLGWAVGLLVCLSLFASFPLKKLFQLDGFVQEVPVTLIYGAVLWVVGAGWKRSWKNEK